MIDVTLRFSSPNEALAALLQLTRPLPGEVNITMNEPASPTTSKEPTSIPVAVGRVEDGSPLALSPAPVTLADLRAAVKAHGTSQGTAATQAVLASHGVTRLSDADPSVWPALLAALS